MYVHTFPSAGLEPEEDSGYTTTNDPLADFSVKLDTGAETPKFINVADIATVANNNTPRTIIIIFMATSYKTQCMTENSQYRLEHRERL